MSPYAQEIALNLTRPLCVSDVLGTDTMDIWLGWLAPHRVLNYVDGTMCRGATILADALQTTAVRDRMWDLLPVSFRAELAREYIRRHHELSDITDEEMNASDVLMLANAKIIDDDEKEDALEILRKEED